MRNMHNRVMLTLIVGFVAALWVAAIVASTAHGAGGAGAPGTFLTTYKGGYVDACKVTAIEPVLYPVGDGTLRIPLTRVTLTTGRTYVLSEGEGQPVQVVQAVVFIREDTAGLCL